MNINTPIEERIANCKRIIERANSNFEYDGGFTNSESNVDVRCKVCGNVFTKSMITLRHYKKKHICPFCAENERQTKIAEGKAKREIDVYLKKVKSTKSEQYQMTECKCCGEMFIALGHRTTYCSDACSKRVMNAISKDKRLVRMKAKLIDRGITIERLFERDNGCCALCGEQCDLNDYYYKGATFIAGENYPSIDHIIPLSKGGEHSWNNVQLAHRSCNTQKSAKIALPGD